jgi:CRISPR-associated protein Csx17
MNEQMTVTFNGCRPDPLASYLKALALLRLVSEQKDRQARGWWENDLFHLRSALDPEGVLRFLSYEYAPTPIVAPWNGGSGFFSSDRKAGIDAIKGSVHPRFQEYSKVISLSERVLSDLNINSAPSGTAHRDLKQRLLIECRSVLPDQAVVWMDAAYMLTSGGVQFPPLLGTGGNDGRLEFTNNLMQRLIEMIDPSSGEPTKDSEDLCRAALWSSSTSKLQGSLPVGQFLPGGAGGANAGPGYDSESLINPWDFILLMEGSLLFGAAVTKRLQAADPGVLSSPFTVRSSMAGYASAAPNDKARAEIWLPLWEKAATLAELKMLFSEGRSQVGRRPSRSGVDFARAIATLGVDRGVSAFHRVGFIERNGQAYLATPLGRWPVLARPEVTLVDDIDSWLDRFRIFSLASRTPASFGRCLRNIEAAILGVCKDATATQWQRLIVVLGEAERQMAKSPKRTKDNRLSPLPRLRPDWLKQADDGSPEFRLAASLASIYDAKLGALRANMIPMALGKPYPAFNLEKMDDNAVVWAEGSLTDNMNAVIERRLLEYRRGDLDSLPLKGSLPADLEDVRLFMEGGIDEGKLEKLLWGLNAVDWYRIRGGGSSERLGDPLVPAAYALLKLTHNPDPVRLDWTAPGTPVPLDPAIFARAKRGQIAAACASACHRLKASGLPTKTQNFIISSDMGKRIAAAILFPVREADNLYLARLALKPLTRTGT